VEVSQYVGTYSYYPMVTQCWNWQWDPNGLAEQAAAAEAQRAAVQRAREEETAEQAQRAAELARLEVQREAARVQATAAAKIAAEESPDNICREPKVAGRVLDDFNSMDWADGRQHRHRAPCHDLQQRRKLPFVPRRLGPQGRSADRGNPDREEQRSRQPDRSMAAGTGEPTPNYSSGLKPKPELLPAGKPSGPTTVPATTDAATTTSASFQDGAADRLAWETWFNGLSGEERDGAYYWAAQRSLKTPSDCGRLGGAGQVGCIEAKARLSPSDARRKNGPDYKAGWNSIHTN
jgi:hypothetical protein